MIERNIKTISVIIIAMMSSCGITNNVEFSHENDLIYTSEEWYYENLDCENCDEID